MLADRARMGSCAGDNTLDLFSKFVKGTCSGGDGSYEVTLGNDKIYLYAIDRNSYAQVVSNVPVNLSLYSNIKINWQGLVTDFSREGGLIISSSKLGDINSYDEKIIIGKNTSTIEEHIFDISGIQGDKYIRFFVKGARTMLGVTSASMSLYSITLE